MNQEATNRIRVLRSGELDDADRKALADIEQHGVHIIHVRPEKHSPGWSYTIGLWPELVVTGLKPDLAHTVLNEAVSRLNSGVPVEHGTRTDAGELLANVQCEFREVEQRWAGHILGWAVWFHGNADFPVLQCVYPDLQNRFPWEEGFDGNWRDRQPLLFDTPLAGRVEQDFWSANDPDSSLFDWKFEDPPHTGVYTIRRIEAGEEPVMYVSHDSDGAWQFHGAGASKVEDAVLICFHHILDRDPSIKHLSDLPRGWYAERDSPDGEWRRGENPPEEEVDAQT